MSGGGTGGCLTTTVFYRFNVSVSKLMVVLRSGKMLSFFENEEAGERSCLCDTDYSGSSLG